MMQRITFLTSIIFFLFFLSGCGEQRINGETNKQIRQSYTEVKNSLPKDKQDKFRESVIFILMKDKQNLEGAFELLGGALTSEGESPKEKAVNGALKNSENVDLLRGKTSEEVIRMADSIKIQQEVQELKKEVQESKESVDELREKVERGQQSKQALKNVEIESGISEDDNSFTNNNEVDLKVFNGIEKSVRKIEIDCIYVNEDESVTYAEDIMRFELPSTLPPGERNTFAGDPPYSSEFKNVTLYENAEFLCDAVKVWGPSSSGPIYQTSFEYSSSDISFGDNEKQLNELKTILEEKEDNLDSLTTKRDSLLSLQNK